MKKLLLSCMLLLLLASCGSSSSGGNPADLYFNKLYSSSSSNENPKTLLFYEDEELMELIKENGAKETFSFEILDDGNSDYDLSDFCGTFSASEDKVLEYTSVGLSQNSQEDAKLVILEVEGKCSDTGAEMQCAAVFVYEDHDSDDVVEGHLFKLKTGGCSDVRTNLEALINNQVNGSGARQ